MRYTSKTTPPLNQPMLIIHHPTLYQLCHKLNSTTQEVILYDQKHKHIHSNTGLFKEKFPK